MTIIYIYLDKLYSALRVRLWKSSSILLMAKNQPSFKYSLTFVSFWDSIVTRKKIKLDFDITPAKWILWFKIIPAKTLQTTEWMTNSLEFWCLSQGFPKFYIKWIQIMEKLNCWRIIFQYPDSIRTFQCQTCCLNSKTFPKILFFVICNVKRKWSIRYSVHFLAQQKEPLNKQNSLNPYGSSYLRFLEGFLVTTTTTQGVSFH